jgi:formamidopyrimidine-DNA glycosylase-like protein
MKVQMRLSKLTDLSPRQQEIGDRITSRRGGTRGRCAAIKAVLIDPKAIAGLGNLLGDEMLWRAGIQPRRPARSLTAQERRGLHRQMRSMLGAAIRAGRVPPRPSWLTGVRDQQDPRCLRVALRCAGSGHATWSGCSCSAYRKASRTCFGPNGRSWW